MLGLASGAIVFGVALSGAVYVFEEEIRGLYQQRYTRVPPRDLSARLAPSELRRRGEAALLGALGTLDPPLVESRSPYSRGAIGGACGWLGVCALRS